MATQPTPRISVAEYLELEAVSPDRHEYLDGEIFEMEAASAAHSLIALNVAGELRSRLKGKNCLARGSDMRIRTSPNGLHSYADAVVTCGRQELDGETLLNPVVIAEVLSRSTEGHDRGTKFERYREIPSFREYLVIAQDRPYVEHHVWAGPRFWTMREYTSLKEVIALETLGVSLPLEEIYFQVAFGDVDVD